VPARGGEVKLAYAPERRVVNRPAHSGEGAVTHDHRGVGQLGTPAEVVRIDPVKQKLTNLTDFNVANAERMDWLPPENFWFTSKAGKKIHSMIIKPAGFMDSNKYPAVRPHPRRPAGQWRDHRSPCRWNYPPPGQAGLRPPAHRLHRLDRLRREVRAGDRGRSAEGPGDELNEAADEAIKRYPFIDGTRQAAGGASYGGHSRLLA